jgi:hypothetical protein
LEIHPKSRLSVIIQLKVTKTIIKSFKFSLLHCFGKIIRFDLPKTSLIEAVRSSLVLLHFSICLTTSKQLQGYLPVNIFVQLLLINPMNMMSKLIWPNGRSNSSIFKRRKNKNKLKSPFATKNSVEFPGHKSSGLFVIF